MKKPAMSNMVPRFIRIAALLLCLLAAAFSPASAADPGSAADPLVSKSWVDGYVQEQFKDLQNQIDSLKQEMSKFCHIVLTIGSRTAYVNGKAVVMDTEAAIMGAGYTMVPARMIGESMGMTVSWDAAKRQVSYGYGGNTMVLKIGSTTAYVNGAAYTLPYAPIINSANRTLVHVRFAEALGCTFNWDPQKRQVDIYRR
ncbi:MAG: copper amine oxidase N-terminal domain-containing protein [Firmicutes bacterium]|nr:copper amine oxidase N-terminal domain-containing protein [Bacillota bacterium]